MDYIFKSAFQKEKMFDLNGLNCMGTFESKRSLFE